MATYFYSQSTGANGNAGTTMGSPKQTLANLTTTLVSGDAAYLKRGDVWAEALVIPAGCKVGAYGFGNPPVIDLADAGGSVGIPITAKANITVEDVWVRNCEVGSQLLGLNTNNITFIRCWASSCTVDGFQTGTGDPVNHGGTNLVYRECKSWDHLAGDGFSIGCNFHGKYYDCVAWGCIGAQADGFTSHDTSTMDLYRCKSYANRDGVHLTNTTGDCTVDGCWIFDNLEEGVQSNVGGSVSHRLFLQNCQISMQAATTAANECGVRIVGGGVQGFIYNNTFDNRNNGGGAAVPSHCVGSFGGLVLVRDNLMKINANLNARFLYLQSGIGELVSADTNLYYPDGGLVRFQAGGSTYTYAAWKALGGAADPNSPAAADALLTGDIAVLIENGRLKAGSPALGAAANLMGTNDKDLRGFFRQPTAAYDMGAWRKDA